MNLTLPPRGQRVTSPKLAALQAPMCVCGAPLSSEGYEQAYCTDSRCGHYSTPQFPALRGVRCPCGALLDGQHTLCIIPSEREKREWARFAQAAYGADRNDIGHRFSGAAARLAIGAPMKSAQFHELQNEYRAWLMFGEYRAEEAQQIVG